jgi:mRNA interferase MazF
LKRGDIYYVHLDLTVGSEQQKSRPCLIVRRDPPAGVEDTNPMTIIVPIGDANGRSGNLLHVFVSAGVGGLTKDSRVLCQQIRAVDKRRIGGKIGQLPPDLLQHVSVGLRAVLDV